MKEYFLSKPNFEKLVAVLLREASVIAPAEFDGHNILAEVKVTPSKTSICPASARSNRINRISSN